MYRVRINSRFNIKQAMELFRQEGWWPEYVGAEEDLRKAIKGSFAHACLYRDGRMVGIARVASDGSSEAYIHDVTVLKSCRGKGAGKKMVDALVKHLLGKGINWIVLIAQPGTEAFWDKRGFGRMKKHVPMKYRVKE